MFENQYHSVDQAIHNLTQLQDQVKRLIGICVLKSQEFENLIRKKLCFNASISCDVNGNIVSDNRPDLANKPLGILIDQFFKSITPTENFIENNDSISLDDFQNSNSKNFFYFKSNSFLPQAELDKLKIVWKELLESRNRIVHHFYEDNTIATIEGCLIAKERLTLLAEQMDVNLLQIQRSLNNDKYSAEILSSDFIVQLIDSLIDEDKDEDEDQDPLQLMIKELSKASKLFSKEGWTELQLAKQWITDKLPELFKHCGYKSWQQLVHESKAFDLMYRDLGAKPQACYRVRLKKTI